MDRSAIAVCCGLFKLLFPLNGILVDVDECAILLGIFICF